MKTYQRTPIVTPKIGGIALRAFISAIESPVGPMVVQKLTVGNGLDTFRETSAEHHSPIQITLPVPEVSGPLLSANDLAQEVLKAPEWSKTDQDFKAMAKSRYANFH